MKMVGTLLLNLVFVFGSASVAMAESPSQSAAKKDLQLLEKFKDSSIVAKGILKRRCLKNPEISELCKSSASELSGADLSEVKETVVSDLEKEVSEEPKMESQAVNVSSGDGTQSSNVSVGSYPGAACVAAANAAVQRATQNVTKVTAGLNARLNKRK
ncbi:hypothetical protein [Bdellovibrio sp. HCB337]|uniref:hypothetical protein n=1 Tax=Bdellovibrio sp. HCB337 TaxID=3394358 RepID=UPI0039A73246